MPALSTDAILRRLEDDNFERRLTISPLLDETVQAKPGQAAIDVRLGFDFCVVTASRFGAVGDLGESHEPSFDQLYRRSFIPLGSSITIHPHQFLLAQTLEYLRLPPDLMAYVVGRSTWGRLGLIVATAIGVHPNFAGSLTLELRNLGETPLRLYPGQTIAQLFFHNVVDSGGVASTCEAERAQYAGTIDMVPRKLSDSQTREKILAIQQANAQD
ncbi:MAG: dCTP deaminase [Erythrobacter sp.]|nr:dCTP deaminase [Erythrobacter sp.]